jgi:excisionase family DNA binding protein
MHSDEPTLPSSSAAEAPPGRHDPSPYERRHRHTNEAGAVVDEEILTYDEAAQLLKISTRTLERWTREGLVPYIRLPQRGRWSGVRFSRNELLRWLRRRTVRAR